VLVPPLLLSASFWLISAGLLHSFLKATRFVVHGRPAQIKAVSLIGCLAALVMASEAFAGPLFPMPTAVAPGIPGPLADLAADDLGRDGEADTESALVESDDLAGNALAGMQRSIAAREYRVSRNDRGLQAPNRRHGLRTYFEPTGIRVHDRSAQGDPELLALRWTGVGRGASLVAVPEGEVSHVGARVETRREGMFEWYVNAPAGLEHGFTLAERPVDEGPLVLELALSQARATLSGNRVILATRAGRKLAYGGLVATDARGGAVVARFEVPSPERLRLVIDDAAAVYPLTIDPLLTQTPDTQLEADQASVHFGISVAGAGDVNGDGYADVIVGASGYDAGQSDEGAAFVFLGSASGIADGNPSQTKRARGSVSAWPGRGM